MTLHTAVRARVLQPSRFDFCVQLISQNDGLPYSDNCILWVTFVIGMVNWPNVFVNVTVCDCHHVIWSSTNVAIQITSDVGAPSAVPGSPETGAK